MYKCVKVNGKWELQKKDGSKVIGTHSSYNSCISQMKALYSDEDIKNLLVMNLNGIVDGYVKENINYQISNQSKERIKLNITSRGGSYLEALDIFNSLRNSKRKIVCHVPSYAMSAGAVIALAGDYITMNENALLMFHPPELYSSESKNADEMTKAAEQLKKCEDTLVSIIVARCGMKEEEARNFLKEEKYLTAKEALEKKIIDEVIPLHTRVLLKEIENLIPDEVLNYVSNLNSEIDSMAILDICNSLSLEVTNENAEEKLLLHVKSLSDEITNLKAKINKPKIELPETVVNLVKRSREGEINTLVSEGYITPAVADGLKKQYCTIRNEFITDKGDIVDGFDEVMNSLKKNEKIVSFAQKSANIQRQNQNGSTSVLVEDMESRNKK